MCPRYGPVCWLDCGIEMVFKSSFDDHHLVEVFPCFKVLLFCLVAVIFAGKGRVNYVGTGINGVNARGVGVPGLDSSRHDHAKPSVLPPSTAGQNCSCILLTLLEEFSNVSIAGFPKDALYDGIGEGGKKFGCCECVAHCGGGNFSKDC